MFSYTIRKSKNQSPKHSKNRWKTPQTKDTPPKPKHLSDTERESRKDAFDRHYARCFLKAGDRVVFKKPKKNKVYGSVDYIETNIDQMFWSEAEQPRYIRVAIETRSRTGEVVGYSHVWVNESKIVYVPHVEK